MTGSATAVTVIDGPLRITPQLETLTSEYFKDLWNNPYEFHYSGRMLGDRLEWRLQGVKYNDTVRATRVRNPENPAVATAADLIDRHIVSVAAGKTQLFFYALARSAPVKLPAPGASEI